MVSTFYEELGGEQVVRQLTDCFYDLMESNPAYADIRALHAKNLRVSRDKQFAFLSGWLGGPTLYHERYGNPMLRARHLPFRIGERERDQWIACMKEAMECTGVEPRVQDELLAALYRVADFMRNTDVVFNVTTPSRVGGISPKPEGE